MSDTPYVGGYEYAFTCSCGGDILSRGLSRTGPAPERELAHDRKSGPVKEGRYECDWCGETWVVSITKVTDE